MAWRTRGAIRRRVRSPIPALEHPLLAYAAPVAASISGAPRITDGGHVSATAAQHARTVMSSAKCNGTPSGPISKFLEDTASETPMPACVARTDLPNPRTTIPTDMCAAVITRSGVPEVLAIQRVMLSFRRTPRLVCLAQWFGRVFTDSRRQRRRVDERGAHRRPGAGGVDQWCTLHRCKSNAPIPIKNWRRNSQPNGALTPRRQDPTGHAAEQHPDTSTFVSRTRVTSDAVPWPPRAAHPPA